MKELIQKENYYFFYKKSKTKSDINIVFIHGFGTTSKYFDSIAQSLSNFYNYYAIQLPGHGIASFNNKKELDPYEYAKYVNNWINMMNLKNIILIGHSMGGGIALMLSLLNNKSINKLICITPMNPNISLKSLNVFKFFSKKKKNKERLKYLLFYNPDKVLSKRTKKDIVDEKEYQNKNGNNFKILRKNMIKFKNYKNLLKSVKQNSKKTLIIIGKHDGIIDPNATYNKFKKYNNYDFEFFEKSAHLPFLEEEQKFIETVIKFINNT